MLKLPNFDYCTCNVETYYYVQLPSNIKGNEVSCRLVPYLRWGINILYACPSLAVLIVDSNCEDYGTTVGFNVGLICVTALNILWSGCIVSAIYKKEKDPPLLENPTWDTHETREGYLASIKCQEMCMGTTLAVILIASVSLLAVRC